MSPMPSGRLPPPLQPPGALPVVGFGFSFAFAQDALDHGVLLQWTKGFDVEGVVGHDVVAMLSSKLWTARGRGWGGGAAGGSLSWAFEG
jgi:hypothetical protein